MENNAEDNDYDVDINIYERVRTNKLKIIQEEQNDTVSMSFISSYSNGQYWTLRWWANPKTVRGFL